MQTEDEDTSRQRRGGTVAASELAKYSYCHRAWWLAWRGEPSAASPAMKRGVAAHDRIGISVRRGNSAARHGLALAIVGASLLLIVIAAILIIHAAAAPR